MSALPRDFSAPVARPKQAAAEVFAGQPGPAARRWLGPTALVVFILFAIDTYLVVQNYLLPSTYRSRGSSSSSIGARSSIRWS